MLCQLFLFQHGETTGTQLVYSIWLAETTSISLNFSNFLFEKQIFPTKYETIHLQLLTVILILQTFSMLDRYFR